MLEHFSESACRVIFWARGEAGRLGSEAIQPEHLLLGFLAEDQGESAQAMAKRFGSPQSIPLHESFLSSEKALRLRHMVTTDAQTGPPLPDTVDMPLTEPSQRALGAAQEHAATSLVGPLHILWALVIDEQTAVSHLLISNGVTAEQVEDALRGGV